MRNWVLAAWLLVACPAFNTAWAAPDTAAVTAEVSDALASGDGAAAARLASQALAAGGLSAADQAQLLLDRGLAREQAGTHDQAMVDYTRAIELHALAPMVQAQALFYRGVALEEVNRTNDALADYGAAIKLDKYAPAFNNRANIYRRQGHAAEARRDYLSALTAINLHPQFSYFGLGQLAEAAGDKAGARDFYARAVAADPGYQEANARLAALDTADDAPITLRPPPGAAKADGPIMLRPPQVVHLRPPPTLPGVPVARPAALVTSRGPVLRPAIVDSAGAAFSGLQVQLGAWRTQAEADQGWARAQRLAPALLAGLTHRTVPVDLPGRGRYYRLRAAPAPGGGRLCEALQDKGIECMVARD